jgi:Major capsid protein 13-like
MAIGKASDFKIYDDQVHGGFVETIVQATDAFNASSRGTIKFSTNRKQGNYDYESFIKDTSGIVRRRDTTSTAAVTDIAVTQGEIAKVKLNRGIGPVAQTLDAFRKIGAQANVNSLSFLIGTQIAKAMQVDWLNTALAAGKAAMGAQASLLHDGSAATITTSDLVTTLSKRGDAAQDVALWVMHSKVYFDLVKDQIAAKITNVSDYNIAEASPITLNRPVLVTDSASLIATGTPDIYTTLGLTANSVTIEDSEEELIHAELVTGLENLVVRIQGEYAYNLGVKGCAWDVANGGANPLAAAIATGTNWDKVVASTKNMGGVILYNR